MEEKQTHFLESSDSNIKKLVANAVPKSLKYGVSLFEDKESYDQALEVKSYANLN